MIKRIRIIGLAIAAASAVGAVASASALALPEFVPASGTLAVRSGNFELVKHGGESFFKCSRGTGAGSITSKNTGTFKVTFEGCKGTGFIGPTCHNEGSPGESITMEGVFNLRYIKKEPKTVGVLFLAKETKIVCEASGQNATIDVRGEGAGRGLVCPVTPANAKVKTTEHYAVVCKQKATGENEFTRVYNEAGTATERRVLESNLNGGTFEETAGITTEELSDSVESEIKA